MLKRIILIIFLCIASLTVISMISLFVASGAFLTPHYLDPWQKQYAQTFTDPSIQLAAHGLLAASGHNMQPWRIKLDTNKNVLYLFADSKRLTPEVDPLARQTMVSQGTFLEYFSVAADKIGYKTDIVLFPNGIYDERTSFPVWTRNR
jgi:hypothetical protein